MEKLRSMKKRISAVLAVIMAAAMFTGCAASGGTTAAETPKAAEVSESTAAGSTEAPADASKDGITDKDSSTGKDSTGAGEPAQRIVSGYYITTSACIALGLQDRMVGIEAKAASRPVYQMAAPEFLELPSVGTAKEFDLEGCAALEPDLVILPKKLSEQADILEGMNIRTLVVNPESMEALKETIREIAALTGTEGQAEKLLGWYAQKEEKLAGILEKASLEKKTEDSVPSVYIAGTSSILRAATPQMYQSSLIKLAGGVNAASDLKDNGWADISYEQLIAYNPDVIVVIPEADYTKEDVMKDSRLTGVNAVKNGQVYEMPSSFEAWDSPVPSGILGCMWLSSALHEELYPFDEFKEEAAEFYREFYGAEIDRSLITR
ncbi:ABC transporter substrate-binding protein [uncultured Clostridium sp.]|uniref:ABC transporter substrate-binding protein n=1 Tax=uncultured Clostridium sp. TaxID=59620 RepID=UPI0025DBB410|nr:ABC transporter substrate-binding protein [uncultured Clostridium sp.]